MTSTPHEDLEDARMRALFGDMSRPPMGDEAFVAQVMGRVEEVKSARKVQRGTVALGVAALGVAVLWPYKAALGTGLTLSLSAATVDLPMLSGSAGALLIAAAASLAALAYAERG
jgi:uncharacterized membrane protein